MPFTGETEDDLACWAAGWVLPTATGAAEVEPDAMGSVPGFFVALAYDRAAVEAGTAARGADAPLAAPDEACDGLPDETTVEEVEG